MLVRARNKAEKHRRTRSRQRGVVALTVMSLLAALSLVASTPAAAVHDLGDFELDKDASNDITTAKLGVLNAQISSTSSTSFVVCQTAATPLPNGAQSNTILIDGEQMTVTNVATAAGGGCSGAFKRTYTVTRGANGTTATTHAGGEDVTRLISGSFAGDDWNQVHALVTADNNDTGADDRCEAIGAVECAFIADPQVPTDTSIFTTGGSKDDLDIPNWRWTTGSVPDADEILNGYAAKYVNADDDQILYFGADRYATNGSKDFGFWFFHNDVGTNPDGTFSGAHQGNLAPGDDDILILGTFTGGGATTNIRVFRWVTTGGNATANGTVQGPAAAFGDCTSASDGDDGCGTVNNTTTPVPWGYQAKGEAVPLQIPSGGFVEGGINLTALGLEGCFSSFVAETRSSPSVDAQLKDFILGDFEACGSTLSTVPGDSSGTALVDGDDSDTLPETSIGTGSVQVKDLATFGVTGTNTWTGTLTFFLCGPIASGTCDTGGLQVSTHNVDQDSTVPFASGAATVTKVGRYCWRGVFDVNITGVADAVDSSVGECFEVNPVQPELTTTASANVTIGSSVSDTAHLTGTANQPGSAGPDTTYPTINPTVAGAAANGTITFRLYGPNDATCAGTAVFTDTKTVSGNNDYTSSAFTPTTAGTYRWVASYDGGDGGNTLGDSGACNDANENVVVSPRQPAIITVATVGPVSLGNSIDDTATLSGTANQPDGDPAGGTITFTAYGPHDNTTTCTTVAYTSVVNVNGNGNYTASSGTGGLFTPTAPGTYNWIAVYSGDSPNTLGVSGACGDANEGTVVFSLAPDVSTSQWFYPNDSATVTVASGGGNLDGIVHFAVYTTDDCSGTALFTEDQTVGGGLTDTVDTTNITKKVDATTTLYWDVDYESKKTAHESVDGDCGDETSTITIDNDAID
jgi:hypothetical protein